MRFRPQNLGLIFASARITIAVTLSWILIGTVPMGANRQTSITLTVSMQPGNNYRAAASVIREAVQTQIDQADADDLSVYAGDDGKVYRNGDFAGYQVPVVWSQMLTVWRRLHVELDSMGPVTDNKIDSPFTGIVGTGTALTEINGLYSLDDVSANLDKTPPGNGRFENGTLVVGDVQFTTAIGPITANGSNRVVFPPASIAGLPFSAVDNDEWGNGTISRTITEVVESGINFVWTLNVTAQNEFPVDWPDFVGGTFSIGEASDVPIIAAGAAASQLTTSALNIRCTVHDDDDDTLLPKLPDVSTMADAYAPAYVVPVYDVGDNNMNVPFVLNLPNPNAVFDAQDWDSRSENAHGFWVAYILMGFQGTFLKDVDPDSEFPAYGETVDPEGGSTIFIEVHGAHEGVANPVTEEQDSVAHETGHAVGDSGTEPVTDGNSNFFAEYLQHIRTSPRPRS